MNPFDDDVDDFVFLNKAKGSSASPWSDEKEAAANTGDRGWLDGGSDTAGFGLDDDGEMGQQNLQNQIQLRQDNMLQSTQRSMGLMIEAEDVGNATAHELLRQGEQLKRTEQKLDTINADLTVSQKHINSIKSVFGGFKNYFSKKPQEQPTAPENTRAPSSKLESALTKPPVDRDNQEEHPAFRIRDPNPSYDRYGGGAGGGADDDSGFGQPRQYSQSRQQFESKLDDNLDDLSKGLGRLKNLGLGLTDELERQEDDLDRIQGKAEKADDKLYGTNKQLNRMLYK